MKFEGKVAIVTGGAKGLGFAIASELVGQGARVLIADVDADAGAASAEALGSACRFALADVADAAQVQTLIDTAVETFGGLQVMVNNAAVSGAMQPHFLDEPLTDFDRVMRVNLLGVMLGTQRAAQHMAKHGGGSVVNVTATSGLTAGFGVMSYRLAKAGVVHFTKSAAIALAECGVRVNAVAPGNINTTINSFSPPGLSEADAQRWRSTLDGVRLANQPLKRKGTPADVARAVAFLAGEDSAQTTGAIIPVDGGATAGDAVNHLQAIIDAQRTFQPGDPLSEG